MVYYAKAYYRLKGFEKSKNDKKMYDAILIGKKTGKIIRVGFGHPEYGNYTDKTGLNMYPHLIHNDKERRRLYRARAVVHLKKGFYSPSYFSFYFLW